MAADKSGKAHVALLLFLLSGHPHFLGIDHDNEIAGVDMWSENSLLFPAQQIRRCDGDAAEYLASRVNEPPFARDVAGLGGKGFHLLIKRGRKVEERDFVSTVEQTRSASLLATN